MVAVACYKVIVAIAYAVIHIGIVGSSNIVVATYEVRPAVRYVVI